MRLEERAANAVGALTNPWNAPSPKPEHVGAAQAAIGHYAFAACRAVESLEYLADLDERHFGGLRPNVPFNHAVIDEAHVRWAVTSAISALDLCLAAASWLGLFRDRKAGEHSIGDFYAIKDNGTSTDKRTKVPAPWRQWLDGIVADPDYVRVLRVRHCLVHADARRGVFATTGPRGGHDTRYAFTVPPKTGTMLDPATETIRSREAIEVSLKLAATHVTAFVDVLESLPAPLPRPPSPAP